jgi:hypothetical protein
VNLPKTNRLLLGCIGLIVAACASVKAPEGGPKDTTKPELLSSIPASGTKNFGGKTIVLELSEDVSEDNPKHFFLSPITPITVTETGKRIKITPDSGLKPNTTYTLSLARKIKDVREGNHLKDTSLVFSTGNNIDSLSLSVTLLTLRNQPT